MKKLILCLVLLFLPINSYAYENLDLKKLEESFKLDCKNYGNESCTARFLAMAGCSYFMGINSGKESNAAMKVSDLLFIALMRVNQIDPDFMFDEKNNVKKNIIKEFHQRLNYCNSAIEKAVPIIFKLNEGKEIDKERKEGLVKAFPYWYIESFEKMKKGK